MAEPACYASISAGRYEIIRKKVEVEGKSQRGTAKELVHARKTVSKALRRSSLPGYVRKKIIAKVYEKKIEYCSVALKGQYNRSAEYYPFPFATLLRGFA